MTQWSMKTPLVAVRWLAWSKPRSPGALRWVSVPHSGQLPQLINNAG